MNGPLSLYSVGCLISRGVDPGVRIPLEVDNVWSEGFVFSSSNAVPFLNGLRIIGIMLLRYDR